MEGGEIKDDWNTEMKSYLSHLLRLSLRGTTMVCLGLALPEMEVWCQCGSAEVVKTFTRQGLKESS